jgi:hypothetical protein
VASAGRQAARSRPAGRMQRMHAPSYYVQSSSPVLVDLAGRPGCVPCRRWKWLQDLWLGHGSHRSLDLVQADQYV